MATLTVCKPADVPERRTRTKAVQERRQLYEHFVRGIGATGVGEIELEDGDNLRSVKTMLRHAANRIARQIEVWDANGRVYFRNAAGEQAR